MYEIPMGSCISKTKAPPSKSTEISNTSSRSGHQLQKPDAQFCVVAKGDDCKTFALRGKYHLVPEASGLQLCDPVTCAPMGHWDYRHIRDFGYSNKTFSFTSGSRSDTGVATFSFVTNDVETIRSRIEEFAGELRESLRESIE